METSSTFGRMYNNSSPDDYWYLRTKVNKKQMSMVVLTFSMNSLLMWHLNENKLY